MSLVCTSDEAVHSAQVTKSSGATRMCNGVLCQVVAVTCSWRAQQAADSIVLTMCCIITMPPNEASSHVIPGQHILKARWGVY